MRTVPIKVRAVVEKYVERAIKKKRYKLWRLSYDDFNAYIESNCKIQIIDDGLLHELIVQARRNIGFVYIESEEE